jgi:spore maturation protein CgeB
MRAAGYSPSVRLFESAACGSAILSDPWPGLDTVLQPEREIALVNSTDDVLSIVQTWPETRRLSQARAARERILAAHTGDKRAEQLETYLLDALDRRHHRRLVKGEAFAPEPTGV